MADEGQPNEVIVGFPIEEFEALRRLLPANHKLARNLERAHQPMPNSKFIVAFSTEDVNALRDLLSDQVLEVGFDDSYKLTGYGQVLEGMIDRLPLF